MPAGLAERIAAAPMELAPFPYLVLDDVFTPETYATLMAALPAAEVFGSGLFGHMRPNAEPDALFVPTPPDVAAAFRPIGDMWRAVIAPALLFRFAPFLTKKIELIFGAARPTSLAIDPTPLILQRRLPGNVQPPHMDNATSLFSCIFYLGSTVRDHRDGLRLFCADREDQLVAEYRRRLDVRAWYPDPEQYGLRQVVQFDYLPNRMIAFFSSPISLHGVRVEHNPVRYSMQAQAPLRDVTTLFAGWVDGNSGQRVG